ncbi:TPA: hypothetical protein DCW38_06060 [candidate division WOR-3 bacterium]|jgi:glycosyltransferase involved in cell wall biosynthesis|uniref:Glycosyl transferase family 1 domain-containing protein n=1 Tax=candidate division WOR-3 bacterium TaxID=2052148 RepID=A0A350HB11_UNCW3|nr:hypothetical protein [candidate division WOR-3 bacterium]
MKKNAVMISQYKLPDGDAGAIRQMTLGKLLSEMGYNVLLIGMGGTKYRKITDNGNLRYVSLNEPHTRTKLNKYIEPFRFKIKLKRFLLGFNEKNKINEIVISDIPLTAFYFIKNFAKEEGIGMIYDSVEWYSPEQFKFGKLSEKYVMKSLYNRFLIDKNFKVIAISRYLERHFLARGLKVSRIPVIMDVRDNKFIPKKTHEKTTLLYAGVPGKKDFIKNIVDGIALLDDKELKNIELRIIGITENQLRNGYNIKKENIMKIKKNLTVLNRVSRDAVLRNLGEADFTLLIRSEKQRYAKAGFPTKAVESLMTGTPIILNFTSDLRDYLEDGKECLAVKSPSASAIADAVRRAISLTLSQKTAMFSYSRKCAENNFDFRTYIAELEKVLPVERT